LLGSKGHAHCVTHLIPGGKIEIGVIMRGGYTWGFIDCAASIPIVKILRHYNTLFILLLLPTLVYRLLNELLGVATDTLSRSNAERFELMLLERAKGGGGDWNLLKGLNYLNYST